MNSKVSIRRLVLLSLAPAVFFAFGQEPASDPQEILQQGLQSFNQRDYQAALETWLQGLELAQRQDNELFAGSFHGNLGIVYTALRDYTKAAEHLEESLKIARSLGDRQGLKNRLNNLGGLYLMLNQPVKALERFGEALEVARTLGDKGLEAKVLNNIGETYLQENDPREALKNLRRALEIVDAEARGDLQVKIFSNLGLAYAALGNYPQALSHYRTAISYSQKGDDGPQKSAALIRDYNRMGALLREMGDPLAAIALHQSAVAQAEAANAAQEKSASERLLAEARAQVDGDPETLHRLRVEGLRRMLGRLRRHQLDEIAVQVEEQIAKLEQTGPGATASEPEPRLAAGAVLPPLASAEPDVAVSSPEEARSGAQRIPMPELAAPEAAEPPKLGSIQEIEKRLAGTAGVEDVAKRLGEMARAEPENPTVLYALGKSYEALAQRSFEYLRDQAPDSAYWLRLMANVRLKQDDWQGARVLLEQALAKAPKMRGLHAELAEVYDKLGSREKVMEELAAERALGPLDCNAEKLACAYENGRLEELAAQTAGADGSTAHYWRLRACDALARMAFDRLMDLPPSLESYVRAAELERQRGRHQASVENWRRALEIAPGDGRLRTELAISYFLARNYVAARPVVEDLLKEYPHSAQLNYLQGEILLYLQRAEEAAPFLRKAVRAQPENLHAQAALARGLITLGRHEEAIPHLEKALPLDDDGSLVYQLARAYRRTGDKEREAEMLKRYQEIKQAIASTPEALPEQ